MAAPAFQDERAALVEHAPETARALREQCRLAARFFAIGAAGRLGFARNADYAMTRLGVSGRCFQDRARVGKVIAELPGLEAAWLAGELGWTKVRLLVRVARPEDEAEWLGLARSVSTSELECWVRAVDRAAAALAAEDRRENDEGRQMVALAVAPGLRPLVRRCLEVARRVSGEKLGMGDAMEAVAAEAFAALPCTVPGAGEEPAPPVQPEELLPPGLRGRRGLRPRREPVAGLDAFALDARLVEGVRREQRADARFAERLLRVYEGPRVGSFARYVKDELGISPRRARMLLRLARAARRAPALGRAFAEGRISWLKAHALVPVLGLPGAERWLGAWLERAAATTVRRLEELVAEAVESAEAALASDGGEEAGRQVRAPRTARGARVRLLFAAETAAARVFRGVLAHVRRCLEARDGHLASESEAMEWMCVHFLLTWAPERIPARHRVFVRDGWRCTVPGCSSYRDLQDHHVLFRSRGGGDELANRTTLCVAHHQHGVHAGRLRITGRAPDALVFELGLRDGREPLLRYDADERLLQP